jgi:Mn-dependent DtxR family transcriptional regulator
MGLAPKVLSDTLKALRRDGLVERSEYAGMPPRVEHSLRRSGSLSARRLQRCGNGITVLVYDIIGRVRGTMSRGKRLA